MKTTEGAWYLEISVGVQALQRYPTGCRTVIGEQLGQVIEMLIICSHRDID